MKRLEKVLSKAEAFVRRGIVKGKHIGGKVSEDDVAQFCDAHRIAWNEKDLKPVADYLNGQRRSMDYDRLPAYVQGIVNTWEKVHKGEKI